MRDDNLWKQKDRKHSNVDSSLHYEEVCQPIVNLVIDNQHNNEVKSENSEIGNLDYAPYVPYKIWTPSWQWSVPEKG